jgi:glyoxylase-like metal-dependent hydrolase (beta-lactamase superfamily II)
MEPTAIQTEISPADVAARIEAGEPLQILDVRAPHRLAQGVIEHARPELFFNVPNSQLFDMPHPRLAGLKPELPVVAVCGHGHSSQQAVQPLKRHGYRVQSMTGGMAAWMQLLIPRELPVPAGFDRLVQFDRIGKGGLSYLLVSGAEALAIDVPRNTEVIEAAAAGAAARIIGVADTHMHADYLSGGLALAQRMGAPYCLHPADATSPYDGTAGNLDFVPLTDGQQLHIGKGILAARHMPGHTEGSVCFMAGDDAAFTGDLIFIASIGRPDLAAKTEAWSAQLFHSLQRAKAEWPAGVRIYPAHYGSSAERNADRSIGRDFGSIRENNKPGLGFEDRQAFQDWIKGHLSTPPEQYRRIKLVNLGLEEVTEFEAEELEGGKNECALR